MGALSSTRARATPAHLRPSHDACVASDEIAVEAWLTSALIVQPAALPARVITMSADEYARNFILGQDGDRWIFRLRTTTTTLNGQPVEGVDFAAPAGSVSLQQQHVVFTRDAAGAVRIYVDGVRVGDDSVVGTFATWDPSYALLVANETAATDSREWRGDLAAVAVFCRALDDAEVADRYLAGPS